MQILDAGISGKSSKSVQKKWSDLRLDRDYRKIVDVLNPNAAPRPIQTLAFGKQNILEHRRNLIISAPTNSGKSLVGTLAMLQSVSRGHRAVLIEPLRALASEKFDELNKTLPLIEHIFKRKITVRITTGDFRLDNEYFYSPPPDAGEIIIATPERLEALLRNPDYETWVKSIGSICLDEAHLIASPKRGPTFEYLLTSFLCLPSPPRITLLSASVGSVEEARKWLAPCDEIKVTDRVPCLKKEVLELAENEDANAAVLKLAKDILNEQSASVLIFVYQTKSAEKLAQILSQSIGDLAGCDGALAYHAQMSASKRAAVRSSFETSQSRCLVTTTSLAMGINLPCTHVIVRDCTFVGVGSLELPEILQMMGRAGRGSQPGHATVIVRPSDKWNAENLASELQEERLPDLRSSFEAINFNRSNANQTFSLPVATHVAVQIARSKESGATLETLCEFFSRSFGGKSLTCQIPKALAWLTDPTSVLAYFDDKRKYRLTTLAARALRNSLPLDVAAGYAQLLRDIIYLDTDGHLLSNWHPLDHLIAIELLSPQPVRLRRFSEKMVDQVDGWIEKSSAHSTLLYINWIRGERNFSRAGELIGSLNIMVDKPSLHIDDLALSAYKQAYLATFRSIMLYERGQGLSIEEVQCKWKIDNLEGIEERWRDRNLWLLSGLLEVLDVRCFYHYLKEDCDAGQERVQNVKRSLAKMREQVFELLKDLKYCSPLGSFLSHLRSFYRDKKKTQTIVGHQTMRQLENAGIRYLPDLLRLQEKDLVELGIRRNAAKQIGDYIKQRRSI